MTRVLKNLRNLILDHPITYPWIRFLALVPLKSGTSGLGGELGGTGSPGNTKVWTYRVNGNLPF